MISEQTEPTALVQRVVLRDDAPPRPDQWNLTAHRVYGKPKEWAWCSLDAMDVPPGFVKVTGAVPSGVVKSGARKGRPKFPKELETIWMKHSDIAGVKADWERETGRCCECWGTGGTVVSASVSEGTRYRRCRKCGGSGNMVGAA